jgi:hypothetical protein
VDECAGLDGLVTYRLWRQLGFPPENTLHDLRWGQHYKGPVGMGRTGVSPVPLRVSRSGGNQTASKLQPSEKTLSPSRQTAEGRGEGPASSKIDAYVWVFLISGAAPPAHFIGGYKGTSSERQPPMYFRLGGGTVKGISKPGHIVWSRVFIMDGALHCDIGVAEVVALPQKETERRWRETTPQWPIMHAVIKGVTRDQMMARHKANHIQVVYAPNEKQAHRAARIKAAFLAELGLQVHLCGNVKVA